MKDNKNLLTVVILVMSLVVCSVIAYNYVDNVDNFVGIIVGVMFGRAICDFINTKRKMLKNG